MTGREKEPFVTLIRELLDTSAESLDESVRSQLDQRRLQALARGSAPLAAVEDDDRLLAAARVVLDDSVDSLEPDLVMRLNQIREAALLQTRNRTAKNGRGAVATIREFLHNLFNFRPLSLPAGALAGAGMLAIALTLVYRPGAERTLDESDADVLLFASSDEIELYDNLEFYLWLADNGLPN